MNCCHSEIRKLLPHRYPLLLVDKIVSMTPWSKIVGHKTITGTDPCYANVPEDAPLRAYAYPLSLIMESFGQTGGILINQKRQADRARVDVVMLAAGCTNFHLARDVFPGDVMEHRVVLEKEMQDFVLIGGETWVGGDRVAQIETMIVAYRAQAEIAQGTGIR